LGYSKYSAEGNKRFLKEKAAGREAATRQALESAGGKLESIYRLVSGEYSGIGIWELPDASGPWRANRINWGVRGAKIH
jgi:uncharacterized protein with GYD domain